MKNKNFGDYNTLVEKLLSSQNYSGINQTLNKAYAISNEDLSGAFKGINLAGKKTAVVGSSGDQALNAILNGCKDITVIDGNNYAEAFIEYKLAFIKTYDYKEFCKKFIVHDFFSWQVYAKISHHLSPKAKLFWDSIMLEQSDEYNSTFHPQKIKDNMMIIDHRDRHSEFYYSEEAYLKLQQILNSNTVKFKYIVAEFLNFPTALKEKYDFIYLSNIFDYYYKEQKDKFYNTVLKLYKNKLNGGGKIVVNYNFCHNNKTPETICGQMVEIKDTVRVLGSRGLEDELWIISKPKQKTKATNDLQK